ncbi:MAG TPA: hypothetical protein VFA55_03635, partial [Candidatus Kapabacteria bacterium]|nr:hypothetical protein [Candidatus Kapabacteria bacterium]
MQRKKHSVFSSMVWMAGILPLMMISISAHAESLAVTRSAVTAPPKFDFSSVLTAQRKAENNRVVLFSNESG